MDSANSGSLQSSSGGDEEYDSRAADSVFMSTGGGGGGNPIPNAPPQQQFFDPLSGYLQLHQNPNSLLLNTNLSWPRISTPPLRSDPNPIAHEGTHSMFPTPTHFMPSCYQSSGTGIGVENNCGSGGAASAAATSASALNNNQHQVVQQAATRNPKKRSRASRRAPTTVLTTDTTNFRAMVQEFTGIPAPPFNSSSFPRSRLDFFGSRSTAALDAAQPPPYLRRPFAQKVHPPHPFFSSSSSPANLDSTTAAAAASSTSMNYHLPNLFNIPNQNQNQNQNILTSLLQSNPKFPFSTSSVVASKPQNSFEIIQNDDQFGLGHHNQVSETLPGLPNLIPSDHMSDHNGGATNAARWGSPGRDKADRVDLRPLNGGSYDFAIGGKITTNFSASSTSGFHGGKSPEGNAAAAVRGEGMVESWICSSE